MRIGTCEARQDFYAVLGVRPSASSDEIRRAHRRLVLEHHPDLAGDAARAHDEAIKQINLAASVLLDPAARARYDALRMPVAAASPWPASRPAPQDPHPYGRAEVRDDGPGVGRVPWQAFEAARRAQGWFEARGWAAVVMAGALAVTALVGVVAAFSDGPVPVSSPAYRIKHGPQRVTMWAE